MEPIKIRPYFGNGNLKENFVIFLSRFNNTQNVFDSFLCGKFGLIIFMMFRQPDLISCDKKYNIFSRNLTLANAYLLICSEPTTGKKILSEF